MKSTPEQHDPDWHKYPETILRFATSPGVTIDLRAVPSANDISALRAIGFSAPFAVMTAFDPNGENMSREVNDARAARLEKTLRDAGCDFVRVDACSPDGEHCECSVAVKMAQARAVAVAREFEQVAIFWFDGERFWIVGAGVAADPMMLPRSS